MSGAESFGHNLGTLLQDFQSGISAMLHRCPPVELPFMCSWLAASARSLSAAFLLFAVYLSGTVLFSWLSNDTGHALYSPLALFTARHASFFHIAAGVFTLSAVYHFSGLSSLPSSSMHLNILSSVFLCLFYSVYFVLFENTTCQQCPLFFARLTHAAAPEHVFSPLARFAFYKTGHAAVPALTAVFFTFILHRERFWLFQEPARFLFSLPLALFGFYFLFIA